MHCKKLIALLAIALAGCASPMAVTMMPRDSGASFQGQLIPTGSGSGSMTATIGSVICSGPAARVSSNESFGFSTLYGTNSRGQAVNALSTTSTSGDATIKAIMSCSNGTGMRCDITGRDGSGGGVCVDDAGKVFDVVVTRK